MSSILFGVPQGGSLAFLLPLCAVRGFSTLLEAADCRPVQHEECTEVVETASNMGWKEMVEALETATDIRWNEIVKAVNTEAVEISLRSDKMK